MLFAAALAAAVLLVRSGLPLAVRGLAFFPFVFASLLFFQAALRTCVVRAVRGERETRFGVETVADPDQARAHMARAKAVVACSVCAAASATALLFLLP